MGSAVNFVENYYQETSPMTRLRSEHTKINVYNAHRVANSANNTYQFSFNERVFSNEDDSLINENNYLMSMHIASIYANEKINTRIDLEAKREAMSELILGYAKETGIKIPDELQNRPFYLNKEKHHLLDEYKTSLSILIDKNPTARNAFDEYSRKVSEEIKKATKTANHEMKSSCPTALSSYADNLLFLTKDDKREKINFDKFDKDLKNNREDLFTHINQMLENDNTSDKILDRYTLTDYIASKLNVVGIKTYVIDDETIRNYAIIKTIH